MDDITRLNALWDLSYLACQDCSIEYEPDGRGLLYILYGKQIKRREIICSISKRPRGQCGRLDRWRAINKLYQVY